MRWPTHDLSALARSHDELCKIVESGIFAKELVENRAEEEGPRPFKGFVVERQGDFDATSRTDTALPAQSADHRPAFDRKNTAKPPFDRAIRKIGERRQYLAQCSGTVTRAAFNEAQMIEFSKLSNRQATTPVCAISVRLRSCATTGSRGGVGPATHETLRETSSAN